MKNLFNSIQLMKPKSNVFDLTHDVKLTTDMGRLTPVMAMECVPGDKVTLGAQALVRFAPLIAPVMHRFDVTIHYFFVPNRLVWDQWEQFIVDPAGTIEHPYMTLSAIATTDAEWKFVDYFGIPRVGTGSIQVNPIPFAAYQKIYNDYYRDQNLIGEVDAAVVAGSNPSSFYCILRKRAWEHDYFTAALPFAQKGAAVDIPLGEVQLREPLIGQPGVWIDTTTGLDLTGDVTADGGFSEVGGTQALYDPNGTLEVGSTQINDLRRAFRLQEWLEKNARAGTRYIENILAHFGVKSSDKRLQRPEYITGVKTPIVISEVLNTTGEEGGLPQGNMSGHAVGVVNGKHGSYFCEEHGWIIGIMSIMPKTAYQQGVPKSFLKNDVFDYYWPSFANIGEQEVKNVEVYAESANPNDTFGYVPRYSEYKFMPNRVAGDFKTSLSYWHEGRIFATEPALNQTFIECTPSKRIFAVTDENTDSLYIHVLNQVRAVRRMPKYGTPMF